MKNILGRGLAGLGVAILAGSLCPSVAGPNYVKPVPPQQPNAREEQGRAYFTDVALVNQNGKEMRLYTDLIKDRTVIIIPFFTSCTAACPAMNQNLAKIQEWLGDRLGKDAYMISISVDPARDTVPKLQEYAMKFGAKPGWFFLGGKVENVEFALKKLGQYVKNRDDHSNIMIIGNDKTGLWKKAFSLAASDSLIKVVESVLNDKGEKPN